MHIVPGTQTISGFPEPLLKEDEAAQLLGFSVRALQNWRVRGGGPVYVKLSARSVRYRRSDLITWINAHLRRSTSESSQEAVR